METLQIKTEELKREEKDLPIFEDKAKHIVVLNQEQYEYALEVHKEIKDRAKELESVRKSIVDPINEAKNNIQKLFNPMKERLETAQKMIEGKMREFVHKKEQEAKEKQAELDRQAAKEADKLEKKVQKAEEKGDLETADAIRQKQADVVLNTPTVQPGVKKVSGRQVRKNWKYRVTSEALVPKKYCTPDHKKLMAAAKLYGSNPGEDFKVPGIVFYSEDVFV